MKLPFNVYDGKRKRLCDYIDLYIIVTFELSYNIYKKRRLLPDKKLPEYVLLLLYGSIKAIREMNKQYPLSYMNIIHITNQQQISKIKCKELHKWKNNKMIQLIIETSDI